MVNEIINEKYGVDNVFELDFVKNKIKKTNLERYGFEYPILNDDIRRKIKKTNLERYGVDHYSKTSEWVSLIQKVI